MRAVVRNMTCGIILIVTYMVNLCITQIYGIISNERFSFL